MKILLITTVALALGASGGAAFAHDEYSYDWQHQQDHQEHGGYHQDEQQLHALTHALGLAQNPYAHAAVHEQLADGHERFHDYNPGTRHDHYGAYQGYYGRGYSYAQPRGYGYGRTSSYNYTPYGY